MIDELKEAYPVTLLCALMEYPRSSYYAGRRTAADPAEQPELDAVRLLHRQTRGSYGTRRMALACGSLGFPMGRYRARTLMKRAGIWAQQVRRHAYRKTNVAGAVAPNHLGLQFKVTQPTRVWVGDITFVPTRQGWLYPAIVVDLFARRIVGWAFSVTPDMQLVLTAC